MSDREDRTRCNTMNCIGPMLERIVAYTRLRESVRQPDCRITEFGEAADPDDTWQWSINGLQKSNWAPSAIPKKSPAIASREAKRLGALPKNCHLLPSTGILEPQNRNDRFNRSISFVAFRGRAGQPGTRAENRERGREERGCQAVTEGHLSHDRRIRQQSENAARRCDRRGYGRRELGLEQRGAETDRTRFVDTHSDSRRAWT
jgi:hypothetical protein